MVGIRGIDHIVLKVSDVDRSLAFYKDVLGLSSEREAEFRARQVGFPSVRVDERFIIDLFPLKDGVAPPRDANVDHFCLVTDAEDLAPLVAHLEQHGVRVLRGPLPRWGAQGMATSVYLLDPDGNQVEIRTYAPTARAAARQGEAAGVD